MPAHTTRLIHLFSTAVLVAATVLGSTPLQTANAANTSGTLGKEGLPRSITPRGELSAEEKATIDLFERARDSVVFITTSSREIGAMRGIRLSRQ